jgi:hypothetical protein
MRKFIQVAVPLSKLDNNFLQLFSNKLGIGKSEFLRLFIQALCIGSNKNNDKPIEIGGYGIDFTNTEREIIIEKVIEILNNYLNYDKEIIIQDKINSSKNRRTIK